MSEAASFMNISVDDINTFTQQSSFNQTCVNTCEALANAVNYYNITLYHSIVLC